MAHRRLVATPEERERLLRKYRDRVPMGPTEIGLALGISRERARQIERTALWKLRGGMTVGGRANHRWAGDVELVRQCVRCGLYIAPDETKGPGAWLVKAPGAAKWRRAGGSGSHDYRELPDCPGKEC
jgi:hypothetical protein